MNQIDPEIMTVEAVYGKLREEADKLDKEFWAEYPHAWTTLTTEEQGMIAELMRPDFFADGVPRGFDEKTCSFLLKLSHSKAINYSLDNRGFQRFATNFWLRSPKHRSIERIMRFAQRFGMIDRVERHSIESAMQRIEQEKLTPEEYEIIANFVGNYYLDEE